MATLWLAIIGYFGHYTLETNNKLISLFNVYVFLQNYPLLYKIY